MQKELLNRLASEGLKARAVSATHIPELKAEFDSLHDSGMIGDDQYAILRERFCLDGSAPDGMKTILVVAMPTPIGSVIFNNAGRALTAQIPPTYMDYGRVPAAIEAKINGMLGYHGYKAVWNRNLPEKLLAARSGLGEYGRNNIFYAHGLGSFVFLSVYESDMPCVEDAWGEAHRMKACDACAKCVDNCPTGALQKDKRLVDVDRCLTLHNEAESSIPFPGWISPAAHNSLIGCMCCQTVCPMNKSHLDFVAEPVEFDESETALVLNDEPFDALPEQTRKNMEGINMNRYYGPMSRNLKALYDKQ